MMYNEFIERVGNFNSIKVRLELKKRSHCVLQFLFQFHKGTIRTTVLRAFFGFLPDFNSIKVRLEHYAEGRQRSRMP